LPGYILPAFPAIGALLSASLAGTADRRALRYVLAAFSGLLFLGLIPLRLALHETSKIWPLVFYCYAAVLVAFAAANLVLTVSEFLPRDSAAHYAFRWLAVFLALLPVIFAGPLSREINVWDPSGRALAKELSRRSVPLDTLLVRSMNRGQLYSLNFYLRREIQTVEQGELREGKILLRSTMCERLGNDRWETRDLPFDSQHTGWFLCEVKRRASAGETAAGR